MVGLSIRWIDQGDFHDLLQEMREDDIKEFLLLCEDGLVQSDIEQKG